MPYLYSTLWPDSMEEEVRGTLALSRWIARFEMLRIELQEHAEKPYGMDIDIDEVSRLMELAKQDVAASIMQEMCDCFAFEPCERCGGRKWLSGKRMALRPSAEAH